MSPGAATDGVIQFSLKTGDLFYSSSCKKWWPFIAIILSPLPPSPPFNVLCKIVNSAAKKINFIRVSPPGRVTRVVCLRRSPFPYATVIIIFFLLKALEA